MLFLDTCINSVNSLTNVANICDAFNSLYGNHMPVNINQPNIEFRNKNVKEIINCYASVIYLNLPIKQFVFF